MKFTSRISNIYIKTIIKIYLKHITILLYFLLFESNVMGQDSTTFDSTTKTIIINNICQSLLQNYVFPDKAQQMADVITQQKKHGAYDSIKTPYLFARQINKDIRSVYNDKHLFIDYDIDLEQEIRTFLKSKKDASIVTKHEIEKESKVNFYFKKIEILPANIGYIQLNGFALPSKNTSKTIQSAMQFITHADALIIDLRNNFGGNAITANEILSYFFENKTFIGKNFNRITNQWSNQYLCNNSQKTHGVVLKMPLYLLTSNRTYSAAEGFAYILQNLKNATIIGEKTRGGAHLTRSFSLSNGFVGFIPYQRSENVITKTDWEGTGILPTIPNDTKDALYLAQKHIIENQLNHTQSEIQKTKLHYLVNLLKSEHDDYVPDKDSLKKYIGAYEYFDVSLKDNQLFFMDNKNFKSPQCMKAITNTIFQIGHDYQIEFLKIQDGSCGSFKMIWDDGYSEIIIKNTPNTNK
ncbi:MAG: S41 family peptidase [Limnohabitans sp.]|nr:S41 family peptidase [Limnohabitans sp.]